MAAAIEVEEGSPDLKPRAVDFALLTHSPSPHILLHGSLLETAFAMFAFSGLKKQSKKHNHTITGGFFRAGC
jgi:hypothetical protein